MSYVSFAAAAAGGFNSIRLVDYLIREHDSIKEDSDRAFEEFIRGRVRSALANSPVGKSARILSHAFQPRDKAVGDIDLLFLFGNTIWVGEAKSAVNTSEPREDFGLMDTLRGKALIQVKRKVEYVRANLSEIATALGTEIDPHSITVEPFIISSQSLFAGYPIDGVPVIDREMIELYFTTGCFRQMGYVTKDGVTKALKATKFYDSIQEAEANLRDYLLAPPQISWLKPYIQEESSKLLSNETDPDSGISVVNYHVEVPADEMNKIVEDVAYGSGDWVDEPAP